MPEYYQLVLQSTSDKSFFTFDLQNFISNGTQSEWTFEQVPFGEYIYKTVKDGKIYETGIAKVGLNNPKDEISHQKQIKTYTSYVSK
jgi:hypothetical protein